MINKQKTVAVFGGRVLRCSRAAMMLSAVRGAFRGQESGYGIGNVISRLRLKYEDRIAFYYTSEENGTCCTIRIPLQELEKAADR